MDTAQQKPSKILLIGDTCTDRYVYGTTSRLSPEAPVSVLDAQQITTNPGMAGNVNENLKAFGADVYFVYNFENIIKTRFVDVKSGYHLLRVDEEAQVTPWSGKLATDINDFDAVVISDYDKGFLDYDHIETLREQFKGPIFLDTKKTDLARFHGIFVKINELEYSRIVSINDSMIVTLGGRGAMWKTGRDPRHETFFPAPKVEVFDVCGAGDTFLSALAVKYLETQDISAAIEYAIRAAAIAVEHNGVYVLTTEDIEKL